MSTEQTVESKLGASVVALLQSRATDEASRQVLDKLLEVLRSSSAGSQAYYIFLISLLATEGNKIDSLDTEYIKKQLQAIAESLGSDTFWKLITPPTALPKLALPPAESAVSPDTYLDAKDSVVLLIDYQPKMFTGIGSGDRAEIANAVVALAKTAVIMEVPILYTSINPKRNGEFIKELRDLGARTIVREKPTLDALEDKSILETLKATGRKKLVLGGLWTSICFSFTALHAIKEGFQVYGVFDATGDTTKAAHEFGIKRMLKDGVIPMTWLPIMGSWMSSWDNPKADQLVEMVYTKYNPLVLEDQRLS